MKKVLFILITVVIALTACGPKEPKLIEDTIEPVKVKTGELFIIKVKANHSAGCKWYMDQKMDTSVIKVTGHEYKLTNPNIEKTPGFEFWSIKIIKEGKYELLLNYIYDENFELLSQKKFDITVR
jgi:predicted secreted protein